MAGFVGDVLTDPLNWLTLGSQGPKIGGMTASKNTINLGYGDETASKIYSRIQAGFAEEEFAKLRATATALNKPAVMEDLLAQANKLGVDRAEDTFRTAKSYFRGLEKEKFLGVEDILKGAKEEAATKLKGLSGVEQQLAAGPEIFNPEAVRQMSDARFNAVREGFLKAPADVRQTLQAADDLTPDHLKSLFKPATLRLSSPVAGMPYLGKLPILSEREMDIPIVSEAVLKLKSALQNGYYGATLKVPNYLAKEFEKRPDGVAKLGLGVLNMGVKGIQGANEKAVDIAKLFSRRVGTTSKLFGGSDKLKLIQENERNREYLMVMEMTKATHEAADVLKFEDGEQLLTDVGSSLSSAISRQMNSFTPIDLADPAMRDAAKAKVRDSILNDAFGTLQGKIQDPEKVRVLRNYASHVWNEFERIGQRDLDDGLMNVANDIYISHVYDFSNAKANPQLLRDAMLKKAAANPTDFGLARYHQTLDDAKAALLKPNENAMQMLTARRYASERARAERDFAERLAMQWAVPKDVYDGLSRVARDHTSQYRIQAATALKEMDLLNVGHSQSLAFVGTDGKVIDPEVFDNLSDIFSRYKPGDVTYDTALAHVKNFTTENPRGAIDPAVLFRPENRHMVEAFHADTNMHQAFPGVLGERAFAKSGATTIKPFIKERIFKNLDAEGQMFWDGLVPQSLADSVEESYNTATAIRKYVDKNIDGSPKNQTLKLVDGVLGYLGSYNRVFKRAITQWPSYHMRNMYSIGPQAGLITSPYEQVANAAQGTAYLAGNVAKGALNLVGKAAGAATGRPGFELGKYLNVDSLLWSRNLLTSGADLVTEGGNVIRAKDIQQLIAAHGLSWNTTYTDDALSSMGDMMDHLTRDPSLVGRIPSLKAFKAVPNGESYFQQAKRWAGIKSNMSLTDRHWEAIPSFGERMEAFGKTNTFLSLLKRDFSPAEAAAMAHKMHIDYANAKTPFERSVMNNVFFFYSFSRGNATNLAMQLMQKPGSLTTQLHAINAVGEMLRPESFIDEPDVEEAVRSTRLKEQIAVYLGRNEITGLPQFLAQTGLPIEDLTKWGNISAPKSLRVSEVMRSTVENTQRTAQLVMSQTNPLIKTSMELLTGKSLFFDRPITDEALRKVPMWERDIGTIAKYPFRAIPKEIWDGLDTATKAVLDAKENGDGTFTTNPYALAVLTAVVPHASKFITTRKALSEPGVSEASKYLRALSGIQTIEADPEISQVYDKSRRMEDYVSMLGIPKAKFKRQRMLAAEQDGETDDTD